MKGKEVKMFEITNEARQSLKEGNPISYSYKVVHISEVPSELIKVRNNWRCFWQWIPILGSFYQRFVYHRKFNKWISANKIGGIMH